MNAPKASLSGFTISLLLISGPVVAAPMTNVTCKDYVEVTDNYRPQYLATIEGYDQSGKKVSEAVDLGGIVTESRSLVNKCRQMPTAKVHDVKSKHKANSGKKFNVTKSTCRDFIVLGEDVQPVAAYYALGYDKTGKLQGGIIETGYVQSPIADLVEVCKKEPKASFMTKAREWFRRHI